MSSCVCQFLYWFSSIDQIDKYLGVKLNTLEIKFRALIIQYFVLNSIQCMFLWKEATHAKIRGRVIYYHFETDGAWIHIGSPHSF